PMPERFQKWSQQLQDLHPDWVYRLWTYDGLKAEALSNWELIEDAASWVPENRVGQFVSDIARYELITRYGGIYVDVDCEPLKPMDELMGPDSWAGWEIEHQYVGTSVIGGEPGGEFWQACTGAISYLDIRHKRDEGEMTGPKFVTRMHQSMDTLTVWPEHYFYPYPHANLDGRAKPYPDGSFVAHHWNRRRTEEGRW
ncbi:MAG TPA: glycosyltransferase, partial [Acidimicrobiia bacterium]